MTKANYVDVSIAGAGIMGLFSAYHLKKLGVKNITVHDRYHPPHTRGSSHGHTRLTRAVIPEGSHFSLLTAMANDIWDEAALVATEMFGTPVQLLWKIGYLLVEKSRKAVDIRGKNYYSEAIHVAEELGLPLDPFSNAEKLAKKTSQFKLGSESRGFFDPGGGLLFAENSIKALWELVKRRDKKTGHPGAQMFPNTIVKEYVTQPDKTILVKMADGSSYVTKKLILAGGPWMQDLLPESIKEKVKLVLSRQVMSWFEMVNPELYNADNFSTWCHVGERIFYGAPQIEKDGINAGLKIGEENLGGIASAPEDIYPGVMKFEVDERIAGMNKVFATRVNRHLHSEPCIYTLTPGFCFYIDRDPDNENVVFIIACSGHAFKMAPMIGLLAAQLVMGLKTDFDMSWFSINNRRVPKAPSLALA